MADRMFAADNSFPGFSGGETQEEKLDRVLDYVYTLNEQYRYILCQLNNTQEETEEG